MLKMLPAECEKTYRTHPKYNVCLTCHVISQSAFTTRESNFGGNNERREGMIAGYETTSEARSRASSPHFFLRAEQHDKEFEISMARSLSGNSHGDTSQL